MPIPEELRGAGDEYDIRVEVTLSYCGATAPYAPAFAQIPVDLGRLELAVRSEVVRCRRSAGLSGISHCLGRRHHGLLREHDVAAPAEEEAVSPSDRPPEPGPILHKDDLQKGRWGGATERDGRAVLESVDRDVFYFSLIVESVDGSPLRLRPHARGPSTNSLALLPLETHLTLLGSTSWSSNSRPVSIRYG